MNWNRVLRAIETGGYSEVRHDPHWTENATAIYDDAHELLGIDPDGQWHVPVWEDWAWRWYRFRWYRPHHIACWWRAWRRRRYAWLDDG